MDMSICKSIYIDKLTASADLMIMAATTRPEIRFPDAGEYSLVRTPSFPHWEQNFLGKVCDS